MRHLIYILVGAAIAFGSCSKSNGSKHHDESDGRSDEMVEVNDATPAHENIPFQVKKLKEKKGNNELEIEYPVMGNPELLNGVRSWINDCLGGTYRGDLENGNALFRHYAAQLGTDPEWDDDEEFTGYTIDDFEVELINDKIVTYDHKFYVYEGGAHGMGGNYGTTFLQADGSTFARDCFTSYAPMHKYFVEGLKTYFNVTTDQELLGCLLGPKTVNDIQAPAIDPWITEDGVMFSYTPYEIAPYSAGMPRFTIPFSVVEPFLTDQGKAFIP